MKGDSLPLFLVRFPVRIIPMYSCAPARTPASLTACVSAPEQINIGVV